MQLGCTYAQPLLPYPTNKGSRYNPVSEDMFNYEVWSQFYEPNAGLSADYPLVSHRLSVMFMILAIGSLVDTSLSPYNVDAEKYHQLAKAALFQDSFLDAPTINAVQALVGHFFALIYPSF